MKLLACLLREKEIIGAWFRVFFLSIDGLILVMYQNDGSRGNPVLEKGLHLSSLFTTQVVSLDQQANTNAWSFKDLNHSLPHHCLTRYEDKFCVTLMFAQISRATVATFLRCHLLSAWTKVYKMQRFSLIVIAM